MTPDRFIAAAFREWAGAVGNEEVGYEASQWIESRAAELARESVGDGEPSFDKWWLSLPVDVRKAYAESLHGCESSFKAGMLASNASRSVGGDVFTADELDTIRQWFDSVQDCNGGYLVPRDYVLAAEIYKRCGMRVPESIATIAGVSEGKE